MTDFGTRDLLSNGVWFFFFFFPFLFILETLPMKSSAEGVPPFQTYV